MDDTHLFQRDKALRHHGVEYREEGLNFFQAVDDLDNHRQVFGKPQDLRRMHNAMPAVPHHAAQNRRAGESGFSGFRNNRFIQGNMPVFVGFADKNSQQITLFRNFHETHIAREIEYPTQTKIKPTTFDTKMFALARKIPPSRKRLKLCTAKEENVVKPPRNPTRTADRTSGSIRYFSAVA